MSWERNLVFVIMPFRPDPGLAEVYEVIRGECAKLKLNVKRADDIVGSRPIIDDIADSILNSEFIICDLSDERPNIYYELGYAYGVGNGPLDILLIARQGTTIHFDIAPLRVRLYKDARELRSVLAHDLQEMIRLTRGRRLARRPKRVAKS
jgi:hypothetical protein